MIPARRATALVFAAALALSAGCTGTQQAPRATPAPSPAGPSAVSLVRDAAAATEQAGSARYLLRTATRVDGQEVVLSGEGAYDWRAGKGRTTYEIPVGRVEQRRLGGNLFFVLPQQAGVFFRIPAAELVTTALGGTVEPIAALKTLSAVTRAERVEDGEREVRGESTTHYRGSYDVGQALAATSGLQQEALRSALGAAAAVPQPTYDVFLDEEGRLRRLVQEVEVPATPDTGELITVTTTLELYEFGLAVVVPGPPGKMIRDGAPLLAALKVALPSSRPPPPAPTPPAGPSAGAAAPGTTPPGSPPAASTRPG
jgi:hypothetical protein